MSARGVSDLKNECREVAIQSTQHGAIRNTNAAQSSIFSG